MKYIIFSDVHSNLEALQALLHHKKTKGADKFLFLGDMVGYGPDPEKVIKLFSQIKNLHLVRGNHDKVIADLEPSSLFNPIAAVSAEWSKTRLSDKDRRFIKKMPRGPQVIDRFITICHGSSFDEDYYIFSSFEASESIKLMNTAIGFFGHTHYPILYYTRNEKTDSLPMKENTKIKLDANTRYLINPGSIGQPRDKNPASSFIIFNSDKMEIQFIRFPYEIKSTQEKIMAAGLPEILATRLETGI